MFSAALRRRRGWRYPTIFTNVSWTLLSGGGLLRDAAAKRYRGQHHQRHTFGFGASRPPARFPRLRRAGDRRSDRIEAHREYLLGLIRRRPDITLLGDPGAADRQLRRAFFSLSVIWRFFGRHDNHIQKKNRACRGTAAPRRLEAGQEWLRRGSDLFDPRKLVFLDETGASTNLARKGGRCRREWGSAWAFRMAVQDHHARRRPSPFRSSGAKGLDRPMNAAAFEDWVEKCLVPTLSQGNMVVMDNLSSHKGAKVEQLIKATGADLRYLPALQPRHKSQSKKPTADSRPSCRKITKQNHHTSLEAQSKTCAEISKPTNA